MTPRAFEIELVEITGAEQKRVPAVLTRDADWSLVDHVEDQWRKSRTMLSHLEQNDHRDIEHGHWDWSLKSQAYSETQCQLVAVSCGGKVQGLMCLRLVPRVMMYIEYIESAPWNIRPMSEQKRYGAVGSILLATGIRMSVDSDCGGSIGLHSLQDAEKFYRDKIGMTDLGPDPAHQGLCFFEYNAVDAIRWLERSKL